MAIGECEITVSIKNKAGIDALARAAGNIALLADLISSEPAKAMLGTVVSDLAMVTKSLSPQTERTPVEVTEVRVKSVDIEAGSLEMKSGSGVMGFGYLKLDGVEMQRLRSIDFHWGMDSAPTVRIEQIVEAHRAAKESDPTSSFLKCESCGKRAQGIFEIEGALHPLCAVCGEGKQAKQESCRDREAML